MNKDPVDPLEEEYDYLRWFRINADFGPAHGDVIAEMDEAYEATGRSVPDCWKNDED